MNGGNWSNPHLGSANTGSKNASKIPKMTPSFLIFTTLSSQTTSMLSSTITTLINVSWKIEFILTKFSFNLFCLLFRIFIHKKLLQIYVTIFKHWVYLLSCFLVAPIILICLWIIFRLSCRVKLHPICFQF